MKTTWILSLCGVALLASVLPGREPEGRGPVRLGTYDSRAVAVAYAASAYNPVPEKMRELRQAQKAGDEARVAELEAWGEALQRQLHRQGFGRVPVDDLLANVAERLPEAARSAGVDAIVFSCEWRAPEVELVDATDAVVALFDPSLVTLERIAELRKHEPLDLERIEGLRDDH